METTFAKKCEILADLWMSYRDEISLEDYFEYNDVSLPLAFMITENVVTEKNDAIIGFIDEAFMLLLAALGSDDKGFDNLDELLVDYFKESE